MSGAISVIVGDENLDLKKDMAINFTLKNNMFERKILRGSALYDFDVPATARNNRILGFTNHLDADDLLKREYPGQIYVSGIMWKSGNIKIKEADANRYLISFKSDSSLLKKLEGLSLKDIINDEIIYDKNTFREAYVISWDVKSGETAGLEINGTTFTQSFSNSISETIEKLVAQINAHTPKNYESEMYNTRYGDDYRVEQIVEAKDISGTININNNPSTATTDAITFATSFGKTFVDQIDDAANKFYPDQKVCYPLVRNEKFYENSSIEKEVTKYYDDGTDYTRPTAYEGYLNDYGIKDQYPIIGYKMPADDRYKVSQPFVPYYFVKYLLDKIFNEINLSVAGDFMKDTELDQLVLYANHAFEIGYTRTDDRLITNNGIKIKLKDYVPDIPVLDVIKDISLKLFNLVLDFDNANNTVALQLANELVKNPGDPLDWGEYLANYTIRGSQFSPFEYTIKQPDSDNYWSNNYSDDLAGYPVVAKENVFFNLPSPTALSQLALVRNENMWYISVGDSNNYSWEKYSVNHHDYNPTQGKEPQKISPESTIVGMYKGNKFTERKPLLGVVYENHNSQVAIKLNGTVYKASDTTLNLALLALADDIHNSNNNLQADKVEEYDSNNNKLHVLKVFSDDPDQAIDFNFNITENKAGNTYVYVNYTDQRKKNGRREADAVALYPRADQPGASFSFRTQNKPAGFRFLFYRGLQPCYEGGSVFYNYPLATTDVYDRQGNKIGDYALHYNGKNGLYTQFWQDYEAFLKNSKEVEHQFKPDIKDLVNLKKTDTIRIGGTSHFWKEIKGKITMKNGLEPVTATLLKEV